MLLLLLIYNDIFYYDTTTSKRIGFNSFSKIVDDFRRLAVKTCWRSDSIINRTVAENLTTRNVPCTYTPTISIEWHFLNTYTFQVQQLEEVLTECTVSSVWNHSSYAVSMQDRSGRGERFVYVGKGLLEGVKALVKAIERPIQLTQCCTQFKSSGVKILCVLYLHYNVAFTFKCMEIPETKSFIPWG